MPSVRMYYNLESLWVAGARFDESSQLKSSQLSSKAPNKSVNWEQILQEVQQEHLATSNTNSKQPELTSKPTGRP
ncbi:hypothetical protein D915_007630 [Fasciola hepatica]|uniref:Uncharacterized protein n=1 Tax=Fasciola hepatica TaxID=6192 RepID=A0A4E0R040_FASHE|nr:hypothetical protein D915_007630 [Fasciola hepatica]